MKSYFSSFEITIQLLLTVSISASASSPRIHMVWFDTFTLIQYLLPFEPLCSNKTRTLCTPLWPEECWEKSAKTVLKSSKPSFPVVRYLLISSVLLGYCVSVCLHTPLCAVNESAVEGNCFSCSYFSRGAYRPLQPWLKLFSRFKNASASNFNLPGVISHSLSTAPYMDLQLFSSHTIWYTFIFQVL